MEEIMLYTIIMYESKYKGNSYHHRTVDKYDIALDLAIKEKKRRNNKYEYQILESDNDRYIYMLLYDSILN